MSKVECISGGHAYAAHGNGCVLVCFTRDVRWWRNSAGLTPADARTLAAALIDQADKADALPPTTPSTREEQTCE